MYVLKCLRKQNQHIKGMLICYLCLKEVHAARKLSGIECVRTSPLPVLPVFVGAAYSRGSLMSASSMCGFHCYAR